MDKKIGISSYTYTWGVGVPGFVVEGQSYSVMSLLKKAKDLGVGVLQVADNLPLHTLSENELSRLKNEAKSLEIALEVGLKGIESDQLIKYLEIAKKIDAKLVRTIIQTSKGAPTLKEAINLLKHVIPYYESEKTMLALENHDRHTAKELIEIIDSVDSPYLGICLDTVNSFGALEPPVDVIGKLAPYTVNVHFKDFRVERVNSQMGFTVVGCPAGGGQLNIDVLKNELKKYNKNPNFILELWTPFDQTVEETICKENRWADLSIAYLKEKL